LLLLLVNFTNSFVIFRLLPLVLNSTNSFVFSRCCF
jgi:hypothetical protein